MCVFMVRSRVETEGGSEVEAAIEKAFPAITEVQPLGKEGDNPLLALSASHQFQAALKDRLAEVRCWNAESRRIGISVSAPNDREAVESVGGSRFFRPTRPGCRSSQERSLNGIADG